MADNHRDPHSTMNPLVDFAARFPAQLFKQTATEFRFCEFDMIFSTEYWQSIASLAKRSGDSTILVAMVEPGAQFDASLDGLKAFEFLRQSADEYLEWVFTEQPDGSGDCIAHSAETLLFQPPSRSWAVWANRTQEIAVLGTIDRRIEIDEIIPGPWYRADEALDRIIALRFSRQIVPKEFSYQLLENYG